MREVIAAIIEGLPDADQMQPGQVFQHVLGALRDCSKNDLKTNSSMVRNRTPSPNNSEKQWRYQPGLPLLHKATLISEIP